MPESNHDRRTAAVAHLDLVKKSHAKMKVLDRFYVTLAFKYGVSVEDIARHTGLNVSAVREALLGT